MLEARRGIDGAKPDAAGEEIFAPSQATHVIGLRDTIALIRRRRFFIASFVSVSLALLAIALMLAPNSYTATAAIVLERKEAPLLEAVTELQSEERDRSAIETEMDIIGSRVLAGRVVDAMNLIDHPWFNTYLPEEGEETSIAARIKDWIGSLGASVGLDLAGSVRRMPAVSVQRDQAITSFLSKLSVSRSGDSLAVSVHVTTPDPELSATLANTVANVYVAWLQDVKKQAMTDAVTFLREQADEIAERIADNERKIAEFSRTNDLASEARDDVLRQRIDGTNTQLTAARVELAGIQARRQQAIGMLHGATDMDGAALTSPLLASLKGDQARVMRERAQYASNLGPNHPQVLQADAQLASVAEMIKGEINHIIEDLAGEERIAAERVRQLENDIADLQTRLREKALAEIRKRELERDLLADQKLHDVVVARLGGLDPYAEIAQPSARVVSVAAVPTRPAFPQKSRIFAGGLVGSALLAILFAVAIETLDTKIRSGERIFNVAQLPNLANIPRLPRRLGRRVRASLGHLAELKRSSYTEALRSLYLACRIRLPMAKPAVVFTAPLSREGAAEIALGFACMAVQDGVKAVLVDFDPRSALPLAERDDIPGLGAVLSGERSLADCLYSLPNIPGLDVLKIHDRAAPDGMTSLHSKVLRWLMEELRASHEIVVICCAPVLILEDANSLAPHVDGVLLVTEFARTREQELASATARLRINHAPLIGTVLTGVEPQGQPGRHPLNVANYPRQARAYLRY
ncbi:GumC family protein [Rhodoligotrophos defluvii]|uniref:GumC family protein n=1 Tax=Rhodoligotrophos defluvii TaxID=2561934 RepID=UPI0010CA17CF|nr:polysaccharide biosynthesis tyrosine autokinase [Rhodoligotrophos defluvii]